MNALLNKTGALALGVNKALLLSAANNKDVVHFLSGKVELTSNPTSVVTLARTGSFTDPRYGDFELTLADFNQMVTNFNSGAYGQKIFYDVAHKPENGNAGEITRLFIDGNRLRGEVNWTTYGIEAIRTRGFIYSSAEIHPNYQSNEYDNKGDRQAFGATLLGAGLVTRPCLKHLDEIELSEASLHPCPTYLCSALAQQLTTEDPTVDQYIKLLKQRLADIKNLSEAQANQFVVLAEQLLKNEQDEARAKALTEEIENAATKLSDSGAQGPITLAVSNTGLDEAAVKALIEKMEAEKTEQAQKLNEAKAAKVKLYHDAINSAEGLSDEIKQQLKENGADIIGPTLTNDQIKAFAENQIAQGNQLAAHNQLMQLGFGNAPMGTLQAGNDVTGAGKLQAFIQTGLRNTNEYANGQLHLLAEDKLPTFCKKVLTAFDQINAPKLQQEAMLLSGQANTMTNVNLPVGVQREVIREALSDLRVIELVQTRTDLTAQGVTQIPYEVRNTGGIPNNGIVYENQTIPKVGVTQKMDYGYVLPMKIAFALSNELMHFSQVSQINWEAWGRNVASAARAIRELVTLRIINEMQRYADTYMAANITNEDITSQISTGTIKLAQFPLVRPYQQFDMQGKAVGQPENPIALNINGTDVLPFVAPGKHPAGNYYIVTHYNLGYLAIVDQDGAPKTGISATTSTISYSYATNIVKVNADVPGGVSEERHLNALIRAIGRRKAIMSDDRYVMPDFMLSSNTLCDTMTNAESFRRDAKRDGTDTQTGGDLDRIKSIPAHTTNVAGHHLGDERILMGQRGQMSYTIAKPYMLSEMQEARDANGNLTGGKEAYGEEYNCVYCPVALRDRFTSVLYYSASERAAA